MNLISQNCLTGHIYNHYNIPYSNPFIWTVIDFNSMLTLIKNYTEINFNDYELIKDDQWNFSIRICNSILVQYVHYKLDLSCNIPTTDKIGNIRYKHIWEYIIEKYETRLKRQLITNEKPHFCICNFKTIYSDAIYTEDQLHQIENFANVHILKGCETLSPYESAIKFIQAFQNKIY